MRKNCETLHAPQIFMTHLSFRDLTWMEIDEGILHSILEDLEKARGSALVDTFQQTKNRFEEHFADSKYSSLPKLW